MQAKRVSDIIISKNQPKYNDLWLDTSEGEDKAVLKYKGNTIVGGGGQENMIVKAIPMTQEELDLVIPTEGYALIGGYKIPVTNQTPIAIEIIKGDSEERRGFISGCFYSDGKQVEIDAFGGNSEEDSIIFILPQNYDVYDSSALPEGFLYCIGCEEL